MSNLINIVNQEGNLVVSSREVAKNFDKRHNDVVAAIENKIENLTTENIVVEKYFIKSVFMHKGNTYDKYLLTRDGFSFIVMGFTGAKADAWKLKYIEAFNKMEQELLQPKKLTAMEQLKLQYEVLDNHDERISFLEGNMTIDFRQQRRLQNSAKFKAINVLGGIESHAYKSNSVRTKVFSAIWKDFKDYFMIGSYRDTLKKEFDKAIDYLENWHPQGKLLREIEEFNNQLGFKEVV